MTVFLPIACNDVNQKQFELRWIEEDSHVDLLELAHVIRSRDQVIIGTVEICRALFEELIYLNIELIGEEEFRNDNKKVYLQAKTFKRFISPFLPPSTTFNLSKKGFFMEFILVRDLQEIRHYVLTVADLTGFLLHRINHIMTSFFANVQFKRKLIE
ncbi:MAG: hypothetical protein ACTSRW_13750 [Candidatus Helarchaeota archaeon]